MKKVVLLMFVMSLLLFYACSSVKTENNLDASLNPSQLVDLFWKNSRTGDELLVEKLVTITPQSYYKQCPSLMQQNFSTVQGGLSDQNSEELKKEVLGNKTQSEAKFGRFLNPESETYPVYIWANLIFVNKYNAANASIEETTIYQDESRVVVNYRNSSLQEDFKLYFFLKKESNGWKIFQIKDSSQLYTLINKNFGVAELVCKE